MVIHRRMRNRVHFSELYGRFGKPEEATLLPLRTWIVFTRMNIGPDRY